VTPFRFVHCADLHIDTPFAGLQTADAFVADALRRASSEAVNVVVDLCISEHADFLLIAGDVFDSANRSLRAQFHFRDQLARLAAEEITSFVVHGNHDPLDGWIADLRWPDAVTIFASEPVQSIPVKRNGEILAVVHGVSYATRKDDHNLTPLFHPNPHAPFNIGLLHCNVGSNTGHEDYAPCSIDDLTASGMDYWALGHVHRGRVLRQQGPTIIYPGASQGRSPVESGEHGCFVVDVSGARQVTPRFVATDSVRWALIDVPVAEEAALDDVHDAVIAHCEAASAEAGGRDIVARLTLTGRGRLNAELHRAGSVTDILDRSREMLSQRRPFVWIDRLTVRTHGLFDRAARSQESDFIGELIRQVDTLTNDHAALAHLRSLLSPVFEHSQAPVELSRLPEDCLQRWLDEAETRCIDMLLAEEGSE